MILWSFPNKLFHLYKYVPQMKYNLNDAKRVQLLAYISFYGLPSTNCLLFLLIDRFNSINSSCIVSSSADISFKISLLLTCQTWYFTTVTTQPNNKQTQKQRYMLPVLVQIQVEINERQQLQKIKITYQQIFLFERETLIFFLMDGLCLRVCV